MEQCRAIIQDQNIVATCNDEQGSPTLNEWINTSSVVPKGCSFRNTDCTMHFNHHDTGDVRDDLAPICKTRMYEDQITGQTNLFNVYGTKVYKQSDDSFYANVDNCVKECAQNDACKAATWYPNNTFSSTNKACKFMLTPEFAIVDSVHIINNKPYIQIIPSSTGKVARHFTKDPSPVRITQNDKQYIRFNWM